MSADPQRWLGSRSDAPDALRDLLDLGRSELPTPQRLAQIEKALHSVVAEAALDADSSSSPAAVQAAGWSIGAKLGLLAGVSVAVVFGGFVATSPPEPLDPALSAAAPTSSTGVAARTVGSTPRMASREPPPGTRSEPQPLDSLAAAAEIPVAAAKEAPAPRKAAPVSASRGGAADELQLLGQARRFVERRPARALALAQRHVRQHADSEFAQERERIAIEALLRLGHRPQLRRRASRFLSAYPNSGYASQVRQWLEQAQP